MKTPVGKLILSVFIITMIIIVVFGWVEDKRSCQRQVIPRQQGNVREMVLHDFLITAAKARLGSANLEGGAQRINDIETANTEIYDASRLHPISIPNCNVLLPPSH